MINARIFFDRYRWRKKNNQFPENIVKEKQTYMVNVVLMDTWCCRHVAEDVTAGNYTDLLHGCIQNSVHVWSE